MPAPAKHRRAILESALSLFRKQGYAATGLQQILAASGAPKGSLYHYFPGGKAGIGAAVVTAAGASVSRTFAAVAAETTTAGGLVERYCRLLGGWMQASGWRDGCPITTTLLEMAPENESIRAAGEAAFAAWAQVIEAMLERDGVEPGRARRLALLAIAAIEGALVQVRVQKQAQPLLDVAAELKSLLDRPLDPP